MANTSAPAGLASATTSTSRQPTAQLKPTAQVAAATTSTSRQPTVQLKPNPGLSMGATTLLDSAETIKPTSQLPSGSGTSQTASKNVQPHSGLGAATASLTAGVPKIAPLPEQGTATGSAFPLVPTLVPVPGAPSGSGTSRAPVVYTIVYAPVINAVGSAPPSDPLVGARPPAASGTGSAHNPKLRTRINTTTATATGAVQNETPSDGVMARLARASSSAWQIKYRAATTPATATATGAAGTPTRHAETLAIRLARASGLAGDVDGGFSTPSTLASGSAVASNASVVAYSVHLASPGIPVAYSLAFGIQATTIFRSVLATAVSFAHNPEVATSNTLAETVETEENVQNRLTKTFTSGAQPHCLLWHPDYEGWAVEQVQARHNGVLWRVGEYSMFVLLWRIEDFKAGRVGRCPECMDSMGDIAEVYNQSSLTRCSTCYGTTFEGGFKAKIVRPALWDFSETTNRVEAVGEVERANAAVQSTNDFAMRTGDYIIRADGTRWRVQSLSTNHLHTGFGFPNRSKTVVGFNYGTLILQDEASNAYSIQLPGNPRFLDVRNPRYAVDFRRYEEIRGPLLDGDLAPDPEQELLPQELVLDGGISSQIGFRIFDGGDAVP